MPFERIIQEVGAAGDGVAVSNAREMHAAKQKKLGDPVSSPKILQTCNTSALSPLISSEQGRLRLGVEHVRRTPKYLAVFEREFEGTFAGVSAG